MVIYNLEHLGTFRDWNDGTIKSVYQNGRGIVESTIIFNKTDRSADVYCVPTHHYCNLGCKMCHLTKEGVNKGMVGINSDDLIESVSRTAYSKKTGERWSRNKNGWLAFMGVGEPMLNLNLLKEVFERESEIKSVCGYQDMTYAVATMMPNRNLERLADYVAANSFPLKVHFSMHSPFDEQRFNLLPSTRVSVREALELMASYRDKVVQNDLIQENFNRFKRSGSPVEIHYTLIEGVNDSDEDFEGVVSLLREFMIPFKILKFNPTADLRRSGKDDEWVKELRSKVPGLRIVSYDPPGHQVGSSCGEFTKHYYLSELESDEQKQEFLEWRRRHQIE